MWWITIWYLMTTFWELLNIVSPKLTSFPQQDLIVHSQFDNSSEPGGTGALEFNYNVNYPLICLHWYNLFFLDDQIISSEVTSHSKLFACNSAFF